MAGMMAGKAGIVTGAADGIGRATAVAFGREGGDQVVAAILVGPKTDDHDRGKEEALNE